MQHRKIHDKNLAINFINIKNLNLSDYREEMEKLISLQNSEDKLLLMTSYLENNIKIIDIFSNTFNKNNIITLNDLEKYYLINILSILNKKIMKVFFPDNIVKKNNLIINKESPLIMSEKLFEIFFSILFGAKEKDVQFTIIELLLNYSDSSNDFINYCLKDIRYIKKIFDLCYIDNSEVIFDSIIILDNIIVNNHCSPNNLEDILKHFSIIEKFKELALNDNISIEIKINILELIYTIIGKINEICLENYINDFIKILYNILKLNKNNEDIINIILKISSKLTYNNKICSIVIDSELGNLFFDILKSKELQNENMYYLLMVFGNLLSNDEIIIYYLKNYPEIINIFISIINSYMFTKYDDIKVIKELIFCLSNFVTGPYETQKIIAKSDIPKLIIKLMKIKPDNKIYFEGIQFFYNIISSSDKETFSIISELHPFKLFSKGLECTVLVDNIILCLKCIKNLVIRNKEIYNTLENLKNEYYSCLTKRKIDELSYHKNNEISNLADELSNEFEDKMNTE